jgi:FkbM family methyltransferase
MSATNSTEGVKPGDIVVDCGAHVGAFTSQALSRGAAKVIAIEPAPDNAFCLEQNFAAEIAGRQVVVIKKGVWSSEGTLDLSLSTLNSGANSFVQHGRGGSLQVPVTTIDRLVADLRLQRVDYIKMDIEGAEREALRGGLETIGRWHPVLMLEMYHRSDDCAVLPDIVLSAFRGYHRVCGPCEMLPSDSRRLIPHVVYFSER